MRIPDDVLLEEAFLLHGVEQHLPLFDGRVVGNSHQLGESCLRIGLLAVDGYVGARTIHCDCALHEITNKIIATFNYCAILYHPDSNHLGMYFSIPYRLSFISNAR
jgi:hypothetical protein